MENAKKERTIKSRTVTRRTNELINGIKLALKPDEIDEKIRNLKYGMDELGKLQDNVMEYVEDGTKEFENEESWYDNYDTKVNMAIREAKEYMDSQYTPPVRMFHGDMAHMAKLKKLEIPTFRSEHREYFIWKKMFERYTEHLDDITKYDYLFTYTDGESNTLIK